jgi:hypothetical protein
MSPVRRRRRLPTLINRGLGLLEVILPGGAPEGMESALPPGQRDDTGFWFPAGYDQPSALFSPLQKQLQAKQRRIQKGRARARIESLAAEQDRGRHPEGADAPDRPPDGAEVSRPPVPPPSGEEGGGSGGEAEREIPVPLPPPQREASGPRWVSAYYPPLPDDERCSTANSSGQGGTGAAAARVVDSRKASD